MSGSAANTLWARTFADELARCGVTEVVVAPGSRSTPLVLACATDDRFRMRVHLDERSAGFFALGFGKANRRPALVVTTSGTAVANLLPAVVEAGQAGVPLLVASADRPHRLRGGDANQAIDQIGIFGGFVRDFHEVSPPTSDPGALRHLRQLAARSVATAVGVDPGPVHLNFPFDKPLEPPDTPADTASRTPKGPGGEARAGVTPFTVIDVARRRLDDEVVRAVLKEMRGGRGVLVAGPTEDGGTSGPAATRFARATGLPVLADPLSGARFGASGGAEIVAGYDLFLGDGDVATRLAPDFIVRVGASPTSAAVNGWMSRHGGIPHLAIDARGRWKDHATLATRYLVADPVLALDRIAALWKEAGRTRDEAWGTDWRRAAEAARTATESLDPQLEGALVEGLLATLPRGANLVVSNSMPIRDIDGFGHPREKPIRVYANRGASGIDGVVSTAYGVAGATGNPTVCLIGDVAFFHDRNGLLWNREADADVVFVLVDNDGGGIFHRLPIAQHEPHFTQYFATPHGIDPSHAAAAHGMDYREIDIPRLPSALASALDGGGSAVLRVRTDREANHRLRGEAEASVVRSVRRALG